RRCGGRWTTPSRWCARRRRGPSLASRRETGTDMAENRPIGRWASLSLLLALAVALTGVVLQAQVSPFWGGLLPAFGEAPLVGGLADWFAVRALFVPPFGIPFPHTALIPRNRPRIVAKIRELVQHEWLPQSLLMGKIQEFDFVGAGLLPILEPMKPHL